MGQARQSLSGNTLPLVFRGWLLVLMGVSSCTPADLPVLVEDGFEWQCAVGDVTPHEAVVWLKTAQPVHVKVQFTTDPRWITFQESALVYTLPEHHMTAQISLENLTAHTEYWYRSVIPNKSPGRPCRFTTAPLAEDAATVTFVIGGDTRHSYQPFVIMEAMRKEAPDFFVFLGDTIYADKGNPARTLPAYWKKYANNRDHYMERLLSEISVYVMWDDHEVDSDFTAAHPLMPLGRRAFFDYWPIRRNDRDRMRLYRAFRWGNAVELFLLDTRQYRNPIEHTMLGEIQKQWLLDNLAASSATCKFIISSVPFSDPRIDKWGEYPEERDQIMRFIRENNITGVFFLAGDVHHGAVSRIPGFQNLKEYIFGPLAAPMNYKIISGEPRFEFFQDASRNFGKITVQPGKVKPMVRIEWLNEHNDVLHGVLVEGDAFPSSSAL